MKITIAAVGKVKESSFREMINEYSKRLGRYVRLEIIEVQDEKTPDNASEALEDKIKYIEGERLLSHIKEDSYVIALAIEGKQLSSTQLAAEIERLTIKGVSHITFVIGGSLGLHDRVLERADFSLSFSKMTFPHQLMRVILLEQIYRSCRIINGEPYHK